MALSSCEEKYIVESYASCQVIWIKLVLIESKVQVRKSLVLQLDNRPTIDLARNLVLHGRTNHIEVKFNFLRERVNQENIEVKHYSSES